MKHLCTLSLSLIFLVGCGDLLRERVSDEPRQNELCSAGIISGSNVSKQDPLSKRVVMLRGSDGSSCTATPIHNNILLTAAHCVQGVPYIKAVLATETSCSSGFNMNKDSLSVVKRIIHQEFDESKLTSKDLSKFRGDLALLKLEKPLPADYIITPLYDGDSADSSDILMLGYGKDDEASAKTPRLRKAYKALSDFQPISGSVDKFAIDQRKGPGICNGDSGGPQMVLSKGQYKIFGVNSAVSGQSPEKQCHHFGIVMSVHYYRQWIEQAIKALR